MSVVLIVFAVVLVIVGLSFRAGVFMGRWKQWGDR